MSDILTRTAVSHSISMQPQVKAQREVHIRGIVSDIIAHWKRSGHFKASMATIVLSH